MTDGQRLTFAGWRDNEARRIVANALSVPAEDRADFLTVQIEVALRTVALLCREGLKDDDPMRPPQG